MWEKLDLPRQEWERMLGFSIPEGKELLIVTYDGIARVNLETLRKAPFDDRYPEGEGLYDLASSGELRYQGQTYQIVGILGGTPLLHNSLGERIVLGIEEELETPDGRRVKATPAESTLVIQDEDGTPSFEFTFRNFSRDWQRATFSRDGTHLVLGMPYDIYAFRRIDSGAQ
jgi:hypothetical protein